MKAEEEQHLKLLVLKAKERGIDILKEVEIDRSKSFGDNKTAILQAIAKVKEKEKTSAKNVIVKTLKKHGEGMTAEELKKSIEEEARIRARMMDEFNRSIEEIKQRTNPEVDRYFEALKEIIKITVKSPSLTGLVLHGEGGLGKTYITLKTLAELNLKADADFFYFSSHISPLELYNLLWKHRDKTIVLDDVETLLKNPITLGILKSALWQSVGKRYVFYKSSTHLLKAPEQFEFNGKLILLLNKIPDGNEIIESLLSRVINYRLSFDYQTRIKIMYEIAKLFNMPLEVVDYFKQTFTPAFENFNFRTLVQLNAIYEYYRQNNNGVEWGKIADQIIRQGTNPTLLCVWGLINSNLSVNEQVKDFCDNTGYSRRTFFRIKNQLNELFYESAKVPSNEGVEEKMKIAIPA